MKINEGTAACYGECLSELFLGGGAEAAQPSEGCTALGAAGFGPVSPVPRLPVRTAKGWRACCPLAQTPSLSLPPDSQGLVALPALCPAMFWGCTASAASPRPAPCQRGGQRAGLTGGGSLSAAISTRIPQQQEGQRKVGKGRRVCWD